MDELNVEYLEEGGGKTKSKLSRGSNWSEEEQIVLIEEVLRNEKILFGKMKGSGSKGKHNQLKEEKWKEIADTINRQFQKNRSMDKIAKKYENIKTRAKEKIDAMRRPKTGGGPPEKPLTDVEELMAQSLEGRPNIHGLVGGVDTDAENPVPTNQEKSENEGIEDSNVEGTVTGAGDFTLASPEQDDSGIRKQKDEEPATSKKGIKRKAEKPKQQIEQFELENLILENEKMKTEIEKLTIEKRKLQTEMEYMELKKTYVMYKINTEFPECLFSVENQ